MEKIKCTQKYLNFLVNGIKEKTSKKEKEEKFAMLGAALFNGTDDVVIPEDIYQYAESVAVDGVLDNDEHLAEIGKMYYNKCNKQGRVKYLSHN